MLNQINKRLKTLLLECQEPLLQEVMMYSALGEGKRLRPLLLLASCEAISGDYNHTALDFACAVEMIHAYSLAHDDLPAMDNDDYRRGRPTCHKVYGEAEAILAGDGLLSFAVEVMARHICPAPSSHEGTLSSEYINQCLLAAKALKRVMQNAGINGMVGGQMSDIINEGKPIDAETLAAIHRRKTGCLISASLEAGAILGHGDDATVKEMAKLGHVLGMAFQIRDDILDVTSSLENLGKPTGSDTKNQKSTYVSIHGLAASEAEYVRICDHIKEISAGIPQKTDNLNQIISQILTRKR